MGLDGRTGSASIRNFLLQMFSRLWYWAGVIVSLVTVDHTFKFLESRRSTLRRAVFTPVLPDYKVWHLGAERPNLRWQNEDGHLVGLTQPRKRQGPSITPNKIFNGGCS